MARRIIATAIVEIKADTSGLSGAFSKLSGAIAGLGLGRLARDAIEFGATYRVQLDNARAAVVGLTDSTAEAEDLLKRMTQYAIRTPFDLPGVQEATTRMLAYGESFGITTDNVLEYVNVLGNAAAATGKGSDAMLNVITILGKISGQGRVMTRDMNQLTANFPSLHPWEILEEMTGKTEAQLRKLAAAPGGLSGVVDATAFIDALLAGMEDLPGASANWDGLSKATGKTVEQLKALSDEDLFALFRQFPDMADAMTRRMFTLGGSMEFFRDSIGVALAEGLVPFFATLQNMMGDPAIMASLEALIATFSALATMLVNSLAPVLPMLINSFQHILVALMPMAPAVGNLAQMFALAMVAIAPLIASLAEFLTWITTLLLKLDPGLLGAITAALLALWIVGFSPIAWIVLAVVALAVLIQQNWDTIVAVTQNMVDKVVAAWDWLFENVIGPVSEFVMTIVNFFQQLYDTLVGNSIIPDMVNAIVGWFNVLKDLAIAIFNALKTAVIFVWNAIKTAVTTVVNAISTVVTAVFNALKTTVTTIWNGIKSAATTVWNAIKTAVTTPINAAKDIASTAIRALRDVVNSAWSGLSSIVSGIWNAIKNAIVGPIQSAYDRVASIVQNIRNAVQGAIDAISSIPGAGVVGNIVGFFTGANGGIEDFGRGTPAMLHGREAVIPLSNPMRAMQLMQQSGLDKLAASMQGQRRFDGPLVSMPGAIIQDATDADLVAQRTLVAMQAAMAS